MASGLPSLNSCFFKIMCYDYFVAKDSRALADRIKNPTEAEIFLD